MSNFQVGDEVICMNRYDDLGQMPNYLQWFTVGRRYKVLQIMNNKPQVRDDDGDMMNAHSWNFELAPAKLTRE